MRALAGPILTLSAAIIWCGSGLFHAGGHRDYAEFAGAGGFAAAILLVIGLALIHADRRQG